LWEGRRCSLDTLFQTPHTLRLQPNRPHLLAAGEQALEVDPRVAELVGVVLQRALQVGILEPGIERWIGWWLLYIVCMLTVGVFERVLRFEVF
jgi:hypothetical protein